ncbi:MAG TPA: ABC-2 family transporter protein [Anaerolineae bacterium]|nr:ABC-2 family transporter protein [Anaerolineae bacterium]HOQ98989.1 ABC-2 family transporter protein [Anaerolineae bacterium]HPL31004.1 ABC-2 family transporter protein [Anaerolineae bacterium]
MEAERAPGMLRRLVRLWRLYATLDLIWLARDARQALLWSLSDMVTSAAGVAATLLIAERFAGIGPWSRPQVMFLMGYALTVEGILVMFFSNNILHISRRVGRGQLDHILTQPQPIWAAFLTEGFCPFTGSAVLAAGLALLGWATVRLGLAVSPSWAAAAALNLAASTAVALSFSFLWASLAFWAPRAAEEISSSAVDIIVQLKRFPLDGLGPLLRLGLLTCLPAGLTAWLPCRYLLGQARGVWAAAVTPLAGLLFVALAAWAFRKGLEHYGRTGSQRYSSFGHRR